MAVWWTTTPVDWAPSGPAMRTRELLMHVYVDRTAADRILARARVSLPHSLAARPEREVWTWVIDEGVERGFLLRLLSEVLDDEEARDFREQLYAVIGGGFLTGGGAPLSADPSEETERRVGDSIVRAAEHLHGGLQTINLASLGIHDTRALVQMLLDMERRTAMIEIGGNPRGTAFLVGPDLLMTAAHVVGALARPAPPAPADIVAVFDFDARSARSRAEAGIRVPVIDARIACSPPTDKEKQDSRGDPHADHRHLDYALLKLQRSVATDEPARGFYPLTGARYDFNPDAPLFISQHPLGMTHNTTLAIGPFPRNTPFDTRVQYVANTLPGSSGSPVVDLAGRVVALHHFGLEGTNQGVLIDKIVGDIVQLGVVLPAIPDATAPPAIIAAGAPSTSGPAVGPDPFRVLRFGLEPFANRTELRAVVKKVLKGDEGRVLVIDGGEQAGKSHSLRFLRHLVDERKHPDVKRLAPAGIRVITFDLDRYTTSTREEIREKVLTQISRKMGLLTRAEALAHPVRAISDLADLLDHELFDSDEQWWLCFDSLERHLLERGQVDELIAELGGLVLSQPELPLRLVLSSREPDKLPAQLARWANRDHAEGLTHTDAIEWLVQRAAEHGSVVVSADATAKVHARFPPGEPIPAAKTVAEALPAMLEELLGGST